MQSRLRPDAVQAATRCTQVDFWWLDWQQGEHIFAASTTPEVNPTWWLNYVYATQPDGRTNSTLHPLAKPKLHPLAKPTLGDHAAPRAAAPDGKLPPRARRRLIMHRYGGLGNQRYPIGFSGDVMSSWVRGSAHPSRVHPAWLPDYHPLPGEPGLPAALYGKCGQRQLRILEPRHR